MSREGHGRGRLSLNYRSFMFGKLPPPACPGLCYRCYRSTAPSQRRCLQAQICARPEADGAKIVDEHATYSAGVTRDTGSAKENAVRNPGDANSVWGTVVRHLYAR